MNYLKFPALWFLLHQFVLVIFSLWHIVFNIANHRSDYVLAGFFVGFVVHVMLFISWSLISWSTHVCVWPLAFGIGCAGWAISLCLIVSLRHWTMIVFLLGFLSIPPCLVYVLIRLENAKTESMEPKSLFWHLWQPLRWAFNSQRKDETPGKKRPKKKRSQKRSPGKSRDVLL